MSVTVESMIILVGKIIGVAIAVVIVFSIIAPVFTYGLFNACWGEFASEVGLFHTKQWSYDGDVKYLNSTVKVTDCVLGLSFVNNGTLTEYRKLITDLSIQEFQEAGVQGNEIFSLVKDLLEQIDCKDGESYVIGMPNFGAKADVGSTFFYVAAAGLSTYYATGKVPLVKYVPWNRAMRAIGSVYVGWTSGTSAHDNLQDAIRRIERAGKKPFCKAFKYEFSSFTIEGVKKTPQQVGMQTIEEAGTYCIALYEIKNPGENATYDLVAKKGGCSTLKEPPGMSSHKTSEI